MDDDRSVVSDYSDSSYDPSRDFESYQYPQTTPLPPTGYESAHTPWSSADSHSSGSLHGYYDRLVQGRNEQLFFTTADGGTPSFGASQETISRQDSLTSVDTIFQLNQKSFMYENLTARHLRWEMITLLVLLLGNAGKYFNSTHFYLLADVWESEGIFTRDQLKVICGVAVTFCILAKIILAIVCDMRVLSRQIFIATNLACAFATLLFIFNTSPIWIIFCFFLLSLSLPGSWISIVAVVARWIPICRQGRVLSLFSSCYMATSIIAALLIEVAYLTAIPWRFFVSVLALLCVLLTVPSFFFLRPSPKYVDLLEPPSLKSTIKSTRPRSLRELLTPLLCSRTFWLLSLLALEIFGVCQYFVAYTWQYALISYCEAGYHNAEINESCETNNEARLYALGVALLFPVCGIFGSFFVGFLKDKIQTRHRCVLLTCFMSAFFILLLAMGYFYSRSTLPVCIIFVCCCGFTLMGPYSLISGAFAVDTGGKYRSGTVTGLLDAIGFMSQSVVISISYFCKSTSMITFSVLVILTLAAILTSVALWRVDLSRKKTTTLYPQLDDFLNDTPTEHVYILEAGYPSVQNSSSDGENDASN